MKTSVLSRYFVAVATCFVMVFSSCGELFEVEEFNLEGSLIYPSRMSPRGTYEFKIEVRESTGDLTYSWSDGGSINYLSADFVNPPTEENEKEGEFHSRTGAVVSYTAPGEVWSGRLVVQASVADAYNEVDFTAVYYKDGGSSNYFGA